MSWVLSTYQDMAPSRVLDFGDGLHIWRVAANILNRQSRTTDKWWSSSFGQSEDLAAPHRYEILQKALRIGRILRTTCASKTGVKLGSPLQELEN
jgi:hypothetical protein